MVAKPTLYERVFEYVYGTHRYLKNINDSKIFAGLVVITLNIASKFVTIKLSKSMESYLRHTFSRDVLIFCMVWMGSREIYIALGVTLVFILFMDFLLNENSQFCILHESFKDYHISLLDENTPTADEIKNAQQVLERAAKSSSNDTAAKTDASADASASAVVNTNNSLPDTNNYNLIKW